MMVAGLIRFGLQLVLGKYSKKRRARSMSIVENEIIEDSVPVVGEREDPLELIRSRLHGSEFTVNARSESIQR